VIPENRIVIASIIVGIVGAIVGGLLGYFAAGITDGDPNWLAFPAGIVTGFLACFRLSFLYLQWTNEPYANEVALTLNLNKPNPSPLRHQKWQVSVIGGWKYSIFAAVISAALTGFSMPLSHGNYNPLEFLFCAAYGAIVFGIPAGFVAWIILSLFYILFVKKPLS
jgi:hypothetical protein